MATNIQEGVSISWWTESEIHNLGFNLYRGMTKDGDFYNIAFIDGAESTAVAHDYQFADTTVAAEQTYFYSLEDVDVQGVGNRSQGIEIELDRSHRRNLWGTSIRVQLPLAMKRAVPGQFRLRQNYPNPFNPKTCLPYELPRVKTSK